MVLRTSIVAACLAAATIALDAQPEPLMVAGRVFEYTVRQGDTWRSISSRYGIEVTTLADLNGRTAKTALKPDEKLQVDARHVVPSAMPSGILINVPQRMLFLKQDEAVVAAYPVGLGRPAWPTFVGQFSVMVNETDPVWDVPPSIQEELRRAGKAVITQVGPGPTNPLGKHWLGLSVAGFGIHGTIAQLSIYRFETHGCIRLHPDDIEDLSSRVAAGTPGEIIYEPVLLAFTADGVLLEAHRDIYRRRTTVAEETRIREAAAARGMDNRIDWDIVKAVLRARDGRPHSISLISLARTR
jgi:L,D-transpeptidase ErfK/SrfK